MSYSISSYTEDPDGGGDVDDDDDYDDNDDDGDNDDGKELAKPLTIKKLTSNYTKKLIPKTYHTIPGL